MTLCPHSASVNDPAAVAVVVDGWTTGRLSRELVTAAAGSVGILDSKTSSRLRPKDTGSRPNMAASSSSSAKIHAELRAVEL